MVEVLKFGTGSRYDLEILHQRGKSVKTISQKVLGGKSYVCRSYRGKTASGGLFDPSILNRVNSSKQKMESYNKVDGKDSQYCPNQIIFICHDFWK